MIISIFFFFFFFSPSTSSVLSRSIGRTYVAADRGWAAWWYGRSLALQGASWKAHEWFSRAVEREPKNPLFRLDTARQIILVGVHQRNRRFKFSATELLQGATVVLREMLAFQEGSDHVLYLTDVFIYLFMLKLPIIDNFC